MFDNLTDRLSGALKKIKGQGRLTEANIKDTMREVRMALLEADVALSVVTDFIEQVTQRALGQVTQLKQHHSVMDWSLLCRLTACRMPLPKT